MYFLTFILPRFLPVLTFFYVIFYEHGAIYHGFQFKNIGVLFLTCFAVCFINLATSNVTEIIRVRCAPDTIFYTRTSSLIITKLYWKGGIHLITLFFSNAIGFITISGLKWWQSSIVIILALIIIAFTSSINDNEKEQQDEQQQFNQ